MREGMRRQKEISSSSTARTDPARTDGARGRPARDPIPFLARAITEYAGSARGPVGDSGNAGLALSRPGDPSERFADRVTDHVMRGAALPPSLSRKLSGRSGAAVAITRTAAPGSGGAAAPGAAAARTQVGAALRSPNRPLDRSTEAFFGPRLGVELGHVRVHTGEAADRAARSVQARAFTVGDHMVFRKGEYSPHSLPGRALLAHELAHAMGPDDGTIHRAVTTRYREIKSALEYSLFKWVIFDSDVTKVLNILAGLNTTDLADTLARMRTDGLVKRLLGNISNAKLIQFLQQVQRDGAHAFAAGKGMTNQAAMAQAQATFMIAANAAAAAVVHGPSPTAAQVSAQHASQVSSTSIAPQLATLSPADEVLHNTQATAARAAFVAWAGVHQPQLGITAAHIHVDSRAVFDRGQGVLAFSNGTQAVVGHPFAQAVAADPAYALPTIVHELWGHEHYGPYGQPGSELGLELYDQAAALMPGYTRPTGAARTEEVDAYAYQETEIYSLMTEVPHYTPVTSAHAALASVNFDPAPEIAYRIGLILQQFESGVAQSLLRGLWMRLRLDPRLHPSALAAFEAGVRSHLPAADAGAILQ